MEKKATKLVEVKIVETAANNLSCNNGCLRAAGSPTGD